MNREEMVGMLVDLASPISPVKMWEKQGIQAIGTGASKIWGPFSSGEEKEDFMEAWTAQASPEWLDILLDIIVNPPDLSQYGPRIREDWEIVVELFLAEWVRHLPSSALHKIAPLLTYPKSGSRLPALAAFEEVGSEESLKWLRPLVEQTCALTEKEIMYLADALVHTGVDEGKELVRKLLSSLPSSMTSAIQHITTRLREEQ